MGARGQDGDVVECGRWVLRRQFLDVTLPNASQHTARRGGRRHPADVGRCGYLMPSSCSSGSMAK